MSAKNTAEKFTPYQVLVIVLLALTQFTVMLDFMVMSPLGDILMKSIHLPTKEFAYVVAAYAISAGLSGIVTAGFADRYDRKKLLLFFYTGFIVGTLFCGLANSYSLLLAARIFTGIFGGVIGSISMAIVADIFPLQQRGRAIGFMQMGFGASQVLGIPISLKMAEHWGWQSPFFMIVGLALIIFFLLVIKMQPVTQHLLVKSDKNAWIHLWHTFRQRPYRIGFLATAFLSLGGFMMMPWGTAFAANNLQLSEHQIFIISIISGLSTLIIMPLFGKLSDKVDKFTVFALACTWLMIMVFFYTRLTPIPFMFVVILNILLMVGIMGRMAPSMALVTSLPTLPDRGAFMSINTSLQQLAGGVAAAVGGLIVSKKDDFSPIEHYDRLGLVMICLSAISIYVMYRVSKFIKEAQSSS